MSLPSLGPVAPSLPTPRGELSNAVVTALRGDRTRVDSLPKPDGQDPYGLDLQLALHTCYELHYRGFDGVDPEWEWQTDLLQFRSTLEERFLDAIRGGITGGKALNRALDALLVEPVGGTGISRYLLDEGEWWHMREYFVHRSIYHHKEADPHAWVIPRLNGQAKASLVAVEFDEYGGGHGDRMHSQLFVDLLAAAGLNTEYLHYMDEVPASMIAIVNMMSLFGLHRALRGALVGHFAATEITTSPSARRTVEVLERLRADPACVHFFAEHVEADAVHEQVLRHDVLGDLLTREPALTGSVVLGIQATSLLEDRFTDDVLGAWRSGRTSLSGRTPLPESTVQSV
ncbi:iron-containing redox enzyme family protein [Nocardia sp. KC 131]|uniref:iron-containing redox enzyme family protein n=1 Tax=Nocardia arseniciresistens TaxID=3392119 RepID=UPI00398F8A05